MIGSAIKIEKIGWIIVAQAERSKFCSSYAFILFLVFIDGVFVFFTLSWNLRKQLRRYVATPIENLGVIVKELADGNYSKVDSLSMINASIDESIHFALDFQIMSTNLKKREAALKDIMLFITQSAKAETVYA